MHFKSAAQTAAVGSSVIRELRVHYAWLTECVSDRCFPSLFAASARGADHELSLAELHHKLSRPCLFGSCYSRRWPQPAYRFDSARFIPCRSPALGVQSSHRMRQTHR